MRLNGGLFHLCGQLIAQFVNRWLGGNPRFLDQQQMIAEIGFHRTCHLANLSRHHGIFKRFDHHAQPKPAQITTIGRSTISGIGACHLGKVSARQNFGLQRNGLFLGIHQNMRGIVFGLLNHILETRVICSLGRLFGHRGCHNALQRHTRQVLAGGVFHDQRITLGRRAK